MKLFRGTASSTAGILSVVFIYIILILMVLLFSSQILKDVTEEGRLSNSIIIPIGILLPLALLGIIVFNIIRLARDKRANKPGVRFKIRLILFFTFISLLSSIPQGILSISFLDTTLNSWFSARLGRALEGGVHIALTHYNERVESLQDFSSSRVFHSLMQDIEYRPERVWENIRSVNRMVESFQVFKNEESLFFFGDGRGEIEAYSSSLVREGSVIKDTTEEISALRVFRNVKAGGAEYQVVLSSFLPDNFDLEAGNLTKSLEVFRQLEEYNTIFRLVLILFYSFFSVPILLLSILVSFILSDEIIRPIVHLEEATRKVAEGDFSVRILSRSRDELAVLTQSFNTMVSEMEHSRRQLLQAEKVTAWQEIAQRMAHEIKNPLTPIKLSAQRILKKYSRDPSGFEGILEPAVESIVREVDNLNDLLREFRDFARLPAPRTEIVPLKDLIEETIASFQASYPGVGFFQHVGEDITIRADRGQIGRIFQNLIKNAIDAMGERGEITLYASLVTKGNIHYSRVQIQDTGPGIKEQDREKIFHPYFTTKDHGTGLGLAIVERIIFDHKGSIWFDTEPDIGTTFYIDLPSE
jgi:two-component system, NtrC family, nitrogen regulation sensor histidine kinase NtrY